MSEALNARQGLLPSTPRRKREALNDFPLGPLMTALDLIEFRDFTAARAMETALTPVEGPPNHEGVAEWTRHAVDGYLHAFPTDEVWLPVREPWLHRSVLTKPDSRGVRRYDIRAWGRRYRSRDGKARELRMIRFRGGRRSPGELAVAALVVAGAGTPPERVRIREFACFEGTASLLYDEASEDVQQFYRVHGKDALREAVDGTAYRPGSACVSCRYRVGCPALDEAVGVLGVSDRTRPRRTWSVSNARKYAACPARDHLIRLRLPVEWAVERSPWTERGRAVHQHLQRQHQEGVLCSADVPTSWPDRELPDREIAVGTRMLRHHAEICPLLHRPTDVRVEPKLVFDDTAADVVVLVTPDLLYHDGGSLVWREVKTTTADPATRFRTLAEVPQLALAIVLLGRGALPNTGARPRAELEVLHPNGNDLRFYDALDPATQAEASEVVAALAGPWHRDAEFRPWPGPACQSCEVLRWCPSGKAEAAR
ncbi:PD-(D/E)XK nuclease family protein [Actinokineospora sp. 24-640]